MSSTARSQIYPFSTETLDRILSNLSEQRDFYNLALSSRLFCSLSTPYLYTNISLSSQRSIASFLSNAPAWAFRMYEHLEVVISNQEDASSDKSFRSQSNSKDRRSKAFTHLETLLVTFVEKEKTITDNSSWLQDGLDLLLGANFTGAQFNKIQYFKPDSKPSRSEDSFFNLVVDCKHLWTDVILLEAGSIDLSFQAKYEQWIGRLETAEEWRERVLNL